MIAWNSPYLAGSDDIAIFCFILVGGLLGGAGLGIILSCGASTGGSDIIGLVLAKKNNESELNAKNINLKENGSELGHRSAACAWHSR